MKCGWSFLEAGEESHVVRQMYLTLCFFYRFSFPTLDGGDGCV